MNTHTQEPTTTQESEAAQISTKLLLVGTETPPVTGEEVPKVHVTDAESILMAFRSSDGPTVVAKEVEVAGKLVSFGVLIPGYSQTSYLDEKQYKRGPKGQLEWSAGYAETVGVAHHIADLIMRDVNAGKTDSNGDKLKPDWVKMFTVKQVLGTGKGDGLMDSDNPETTELIYSFSTAIWSEVPALNPLLKQQIIQEMAAA